MLRLLVIPIGLIALLVGALFWSSRASDANPDISFVNRGEVTSLDPNRMSYTQDLRVGYCLLEGLYRPDAKTLEAVPGCADRCEISADKTVYTFHIRDNARWNDANGTAVTTADFVFAWRRMLCEPGDYTYLLYYIKGAKAYQDAYAKDAKADFGDVGIKALDAKTLRVTLNHPVGFFLDIAAFPCTFPLLEASLAEYRQESPDHHVTYDSGFTQPPHLIGNGPYKLVKWELKQRLRMEQSPFYWEKDAMKVKTIEAVSSDDYQWALTLYDTGGVDLLTDMSGQLARELIDKGRKDVHVFPGFGTYFYSFNCQAKLPDGRPNPFADARVRRAFTMAIDKQVIVDTVTRLHEAIATKYIPPNSFDKYPEPHGIEHNVEKAKALLAEAGYPGGHGFPNVSLLFNNEGQHGPIAQIVRRQWLETLGVDVQLEGIEINSFHSRLNAHQFAVARNTWYGDYADPSTFTDKYKSGGGNNEAGWSNAKYDELCAKADVEPDHQKRLNYFAQAEQLLLDECAIAPMYHPVNVYLFHDETIRNMNLQSRSYVIFPPLDIHR